jgi:hypothetical protein
MHGSMTITPVMARLSLKPKDRHCHQVIELDSCPQNVNAHPRSAHAHSHQVLDETEDNSSLDPFTKFSFEFRKCKKRLARKSSGKPNRQQTFDPTKGITSRPQPVEVPARPSILQNMLVIPTEASSCTATSITLAILASSSPHASSALSVSSFPRDGTSSS